MEYHEFENLAGVQVDSKLYESIIEPVYMRFRRFPNKESFISFYKIYGMPGVMNMSRCLDEERQCSAEVESLSHKLCQVVQRFMAANKRLTTCRLIYGIED